MRFAEYWTITKNPKGTVTARGWSDSNQEEADRNAAERLERILAWLRNRDDDLDRYSYVIDNAICEEVLQRIEDDRGAEIAVISRNAYGSKVLNSKSVMIVDIDVESTIPRPGFFARLFGAKAESFDSVAARKMERVRQWQSNNQGFAMRVYRTAAGLRVIVNNRTFEQVDQPLLDMMAELDSDPLYRELCRSQKCYRARLTPKPWRVQCKSPLERFPFADEDRRKSFDAWVDEYQIRCKGFSVCEFVEQLGSADMPEEARLIIELHDSFCCGEGILA